jgi:hypothetical protein
MLNVWRLWYFFVGKNKTQNGALYAKDAVIIFDREWLAIKDAYSVFGI